MGDSFDVFLYTFKNNELIERNAKLIKGTYSRSLTCRIKYELNGEEKEFKCPNIQCMIFGAGKHLWLYSPNKKLAATVFKTDIEYRIAELNDEIKKKNDSIKSLESFIKGD